MATVPSAPLSIVPSGGSVHQFAASEATPQPAGGGTHVPGAKNGSDAIVVEPVGTLEPERVLLAACGDEVAHGEGRIQPSRPKCPVERIESLLVFPSHLDRHFCGAEPGEGVPDGIEFPLFFRGQYVRHPGIAEENDLPHVSDGWTHATD